MRSFAKFSNTCEVKGGGGQSPHFFLFLFYCFHLTLSYLTRAHMVPDPVLPSFGQSVDVLLV